MKNWKLWMYKPCIFSPLWPYCGCIFLLKCYHNWMHFVVHSNIHLHNSLPRPEPPVALPTTCMVYTAVDDLPLTPTDELILPSITQQYIPTTNRGRHWSAATKKQTHQILLHDAVTYSMQWNHVPYLFVIQFSCNREGKFCRDDNPSHFVDGTFSLPNTVISKRFETRVIQVGSYPYSKPSSTKLHRRNGLASNDNHSQDNPHLWCQWILLVWPIRCTTGKAVHVKWRRTTVQCRSTLSMQQVNRLTPILRQNL